MNDEFLTQFREAPRAEFAEALYERISRQPQPRFSIPLLNNLTFRNVGTMVALVLLVAACAYIFYENPNRQVGGIWLTVQNSHSRTFIIEPISEESFLSSAVYECPHSLDEAKEILRFDFLVPTWAPDGFTFNDTECGVGPISDNVVLSWSGADATLGIGMMVRNLRWIEPGFNRIRIGPAAIWEPVVPGSYKEVQVNGRPAVLIRGDWTQPEIISELPTGELEWESKWDKNFAIQLYWVDGEILYHLRTLADVSAEDLIKMAESAR